MAEPSTTAPHIADTSAQDVAVAPRSKRKQCIGALGGALGVALTWLALRGIDQVLFGGAASDLVEFAGPMIVVAVALAIVAALAAGLYPTWRACNVPAAALLKTQ